MLDRSYHAISRTNFTPSFQTKVGIFACNWCWTLQTYSVLLASLKPVSFTATLWTPLVLEGGFRRGDGRLSRFHSLLTWTAPLLKGLVRGVHLSALCLSHTSRLPEVCLSHTARLPVACHLLLMSHILACIVAPLMWKPLMMMLSSILQDHSLRYVIVPFSSVSLYICVFSLVKVCFLYDCLRWKNGTDNQVVCFKVSGKTTVDQDGTYYCDNRWWFWNEPRTSRFDDIPSMNSLKHSSHLNATV